MDDSQSDNRTSTAPKGAELGTGTSAKAVESEYVFSLRDFFSILRRWWWVIPLTTLVCVGTVVGYTLTQTPIYNASVKMLVGQQRGTDVVGNVQALREVTQTMAEGVKNRSLAEHVIQELDLQMSPEEVLGGLSAQQIPDTQFIQVNYKDSSPERAQQIANATAYAYSDQVSQGRLGASGIIPTVWDEAGIPSEPVNHNVVRYGLLALGLGLMLGLGLIFLLEYSRR